MKNVLKSITLLAFGITSLPSAEQLFGHFRMLQLTDEFWTEGAYFGNFNGDGRIE